MEGAGNLLVAAPVGVILHPVLVQDRGDVMGHQYVRTRTR